MRVLAIKPGHDGAIACVEDNRLAFSYEAEKDSFERHADLSANLLFEALQRISEPPDALAIGGWYKVVPGALRYTHGRYHGLEPGELREGRVFGHKMQLYSSSHERSHIIGSIAMSHFDASEPTAVLVWEGNIGSVYLWTGPREPIAQHEVLIQPGARYAALFALADPAFPDALVFPPGECSGKLMALAGHADSDAASEDSRNVVDSLLRARSLYPFNKARFRQSPLYNVGIPDEEHCRAARYLTDRLFEIFLVGAQGFLPSGLPLVIAGGCGLNCEWNSRWLVSGHFSDVFVAPCADDSGSAIGTAVDAALQLGDDCSLEWNVYSGPEFVQDVDPQRHGWVEREMDERQLSAALGGGCVVAWAQGRCEIGPRALGHRSLLASATHRSSHTKLNTIKQRERYRPIAPVCLEEDLGRWFDRAEPDPHMLFFRRVLRPDRLPAITHADGTARVQSVTLKSHPALHALLRASRDLTGVGVLCNTSLNFAGRGFINRTSDLLHFCALTEIDHAVINGRWYARDALTQAPRSEAAGSLSRESERG